jgi:hypothetical protein
LHRASTGIRRKKFGFFKMCHLCHDNAARNASFLAVDFCVMFCHRVIVMPVRAGPARGISQEPSPSRGARPHLASSNSRSRRICNRRILRDARRS